MLINDSKQTFCMDGTTAIKDTVHNLAAKCTGTPTFETLLGVQAPIITLGVTNLLSAVNSGFETGIGDWLPFVGTCSLSSSTAWADAGTHSLKITPITACAAEIDVTALTSVLTPYSVTCKFKGTVGKTYTLSIYDAALGWQYGGAVVGDGTTQELSVGAAFGTGATRWLYVSSDATDPADFVYVDSVTLTVQCLISWPTASLGLTPGMPLSLVCAFKSTDTWDSGDYRLLMISRSDLSSTYGWELYKSLYGMLAINTWCNGLTKWTAIGLTAENWAPNTPHIVIATMDAENNQRIFLDGVEGFSVSGVGNPRELQIGTHLTVGAHDDLVYPIDGPILSAAYGREFDDAEIALVSNITLWTDLIDPPKPPTHKVEKKSAYISILDPTGATPLARLTEHFPTTGWTPDIFENLSFESVNRGGYTVASFTIHRPVTQYWADLQYRNQVIIGRGSEIYWEGYISRPIRSIRPDVIEVACLGWSAELNQLWTALDITAPVGGYKMSTFINAVLLVDPNTTLVAGTIETGDYVYPEGTRFEFAPATPYFDAIEQLNAGNNFNWGVWGNKSIDLRAKHSSVDWLVWTGDCEDLTISPNPEALCNYALINYTQDGSHYEQVIVQDAASQALYGIIKKKIDIPGKIITAGATTIANLYLASCKDIHVSAEFTCNRIFDSYGAEQYLGKVDGGEVVRIVDWLPTEETLGGVNDIATFEIKSPKYDHDNDTLAITPTEFLPATDIQIARLQATGY